MKILTSLRQKIVLSMLVLLALSAVFSVFFIPDIINQREAEGYEREKEAAVQFLQSSLPPLLEIYSYNQIEQAISSYLTYDSIASISVYDAGGVLIRSAAEQNAAADKIETERHDIGSGSAVIGSFEIGFSREFIDDHIALTTRALILGLGGFILLIGLAYYLIADRFVTGPISRFTETLRAIGPDNLSSRVNISSRDEIGALADNFNRLADELQKSHASLQTAYENLEQERNAAMNLAGDEKQARIEIEDLKNQLEALIKQRTDELASSEERCHMLLQSASEGIFGADTEGRMTFVNKAALETLGFKESEIIGQRIHELIHHSYEDGAVYPKDECPMSLSYSRGTKITQMNDVLWKKDGTSFPVEYSSDPLMKEGRIVGSVVTFKDITDRRRTANELQEKMTELERFNRLTINREMKMIQLKEEINTLLEQLDRDKKYTIVE